MDVTTHLQRVLRLRMHGAIPTQHSMAYYLTSHDKETVLKIKAVHFGIEKWLEKINISTNVFYKECGMLF